MSTSTCIFYVMHTTPYTYLCRIVIDALKKVDPERRCFHTVGGVLVERTVKDVLPALENNSEQVRRYQISLVFVHSVCEDTPIISLHGMQSCILFGW